MSNLHECPSCGCVALSQPPYALIDEISEDALLQPPYEVSLGKPSYEGCNCCGYEFGFDDNPGNSLRGMRFSDHRERWLASGGFELSKDDPLPYGASCRVDFSPID